MTDTGGISDLMQQMADAGAPMQAIILAVRAIEERDQKDAERRAKAAERKRGERDRARQSRDSHATVTGQNHDTPCPDKEAPQTPKEINPIPTGDTGRAREANPFPKPDWADAQHWRDFLANRKRRRMVNSPTAYAGFLGDMNRLADDEWPPGRLLELAARKGWGSINKPENENGRRTNGMGGSRPSEDGLSPTTRAAISVFGPPSASH